MASEAQIQANRSNARKSTGPRTDAGKAVVAQNAVKHGLRAEQVVIKGEDPGAFEFYREQMLGELHPAGALESMLAERIVGLAWRLRRAEYLQAEVFDAMLFEDETDPVRKLTRSIRGKRAGEGASALGRVVAQDFGGVQVLYRLGMYERRIEHSLYKTLSELEKLRLLRELEENHRQASLDAATQAPARTQEGRVRRTKPISPVSNSKTAGTGENRVQPDVNRRGSESGRRREGTRQSPSGPVWNTTDRGRRPERITAGVQYL